MPTSPTRFTSARSGAASGKTENSGQTWYPISDEGIPIGSIGAIAVAPSNSKIVYVGTGESDIRSQHSYGIGMFKSLDAGKTWSHIGLEATRQIGRVVVDPTYANRVYVAALGHVYAPNPDRGVYRSLDGGTTWKKILSKAGDPDNVGAVDLARVDPKNPRVLYASLWAARRPPWSVYAPPNLAGGGLYKSTDGGDTWKQLSGGFPVDPFVGRIGVAISPSNPNRLWAVVDDVGSGVPAGFGGGGRAAGAPPSGGIYLSDDAGATWKQVNAETRLWGRGWFFGGIAVDPTNPDRAYVMNTATYMTLDAGKTASSQSRERPGGDDYHQLWINPKNGNRMVLSSDQGTVVSVDGSRTWSSWYNQPTAQLYHVAADNRFPYWLYGAQQDSGGVGVSTWSRQGVLSFRNWEPHLSGRRERQSNSRSQRRQHSLWKWQRKLRPGLEPLRAARRTVASAGSRQSQSQDLEPAAGILAGRRGHVLRQSVRHALARPRQDVGKNQCRPVAPPSARAGHARPHHR